MDIDVGVWIYLDVSQAPHWVKKSYDYEAQLEIKVY